MRNLLVRAGLSSRESLAASLRMVRSKGKRKERNGRKGYATDAVAKTWRTSRLIALLRFGDGPESRATRYISKG